MANEITQRDITDQVNKRVSALKDEGLTLPAKYNYSNALKSAYFAIEKTQDRSKRPALQVCTKESIANSLLNMVVQGLTPAKTQCYFIVYGNELQLQRSYFGTQAVLKRLEGVKDIWSEVVHKGDTFKIGSEKGRTVVKEFEPSFENLDNEIIGAYAGIEKEDNEVVYTVMTMKEIQASWNKSKTGGATQKQFPQEMAKRTVINRAAKSFINTSDDSDLLTEAINSTTESEYDNEREVKQAEPVQVQKLEEKIKNVTPEEQTEPKEDASKSEATTKVADKPEEEQAHLVSAVEQYEESKQESEDERIDKEAHEAVQEELFGTPNFNERRDAKNIEEMSDDDIPF